MNYLIHPENSRNLRDKVIDMLIHEDEMITALKDRNNFPRSLSLKLLRTFVSPRFGNVDAARALSIFIFKNKDSILQKYELLKILEGAACMHNGGSDWENPTISQPLLESDPDDWQTSTSDLDATSRDSVNITETTLKVNPKYKKSFLKNMSENLGTIEETCLKTRKTLISNKNSKVKQVHNTSENDTDQEEYFAYKNIIEDDNTSSGRSSPRPQFRKKKRSLFDCLENNFGEDSKKAKSEFLSKKITIETEILEIQKNIEMEKLRQEQCVTQIKMMELGIKRKEFTSFKYNDLAEELSVD